MRDAGIGRVLVASLHQGIADLLPTRLEFYENWFNPEGLREGTIGLAPLNAVLSFLRREGEAYGLVTDRAGLYAAEWTVDALPAFRTAFIRRLPGPLRLRAALGVARELVRASYTGSRAIVKVRRGAATIDIRSSIFCGVREPVSAPLCGFYAASIQRVLELLHVGSTVNVDQCRATGRQGCLLIVTTGPPAGDPFPSSDLT